MAFGVIFNSVLGVSTLIIDILILLGLVGYFLLLIFKKKKITKPIKKFFDKYGMLIIFIISLIAVLGSLTYSEILGLNPCKLCWYQRIMMYPLVVVSLLGMIRKKKEYFLPLIPLGAIGVIIAGYHYVVQFLPVIAVCTIEGAECATRLVFSFGYITIPMMALTAFIAITLIAIYSWKK